mgnify:FL=1
MRQNEISKTGLSLPRKLSLSDLTVLPRKFWFLSNNSFLLHGYHSYGHLLLTEQNGRLWLGVPGIYDLREARAADLFGFPRFCRSYADSDMLTDDERNANADFGHWFRCVGLRLDDPVHFLIETFCITICHTAHIIRHKQQAEIQFLRFAFAF